MCIRRWLDVISQNQLIGFDLDPTQNDNKEMWKWDQGRRTCLVQKWCEMFFVHPLGNWGVFGREIPSF